MAKRKASTDECFLCVDCGIDTRDIGESDYKVKSKVGGIGRCQGLELCLGCFEHRIGRKLNFKDFAHSMQNLYVWPVRRSWRLMKRLGFVI